MHYLLNQLMDFNQAYIDTLLGGWEELYVLCGHLLGKG